jgi:hypothetical protein
MFFMRASFEGAPIFPNNYLKSVENFITIRSDRIDWDEFVRLTKEVPYLIYPAFRLQKSLRHYTLGRGRWKKIRHRLLNKYSMKRELVEE